MPRTRSLAWAELKFGLIAVFALVMAGLLIFAVGGGGGFFWQNYPLKVKFDNVAGLMQRVAGARGRRRGRCGHRRRAVGQRRRSVVQHQGRHAAAGHRSLDGVDRLDLAARRRRGGHHAGAGRHADSGVGLRAHRHRRGQHRGDDRARRAPASPRPSCSIEDIRKGRGTVGKLFTDESVYREFNACVERRRAPDAEHLRGPRHDGPARQQPEDLQRARGLGRQSQRDHRRPARRAKAASASCSTIRRWPIG